MGKQTLKPGEHGEIFLKETSTGSWRGRARLRLLDGDYTSVSRSASNRDVARLRVQEGITERLNAPKGSESLTPTSKFGLACREWVNEMRVRATWPRPPIRPQTIDEYERLLGNHAVPKLGKRRLNELTPAVCQGLLDSIVERGKDGKFDLVTTASQVRSAVNQVLDRAVIHDALRDNPMRKTKAPAPQKPDPKALTVTDVYRLRAAVRAWEEDRRGKPGPKPRGHLPAAVDLMLGTGMRIGEVMALQWGAVNLSPDGLPTVAVEATMVDIKGAGDDRDRRGGGQECCVREGGACACGRARERRGGGRRSGRVRLVARASSLLARWCQFGTTVSVRVVPSIELGRSARERDVT
ncbi:tyrosine-type recombinase/integrase [Myceligenerans salitolerans]|uniref:Tyrosine-type recombinase/integrase family protein n=1 Tax=Myceligenerans salitolerans TaxID=1230528 RepID=A0ABS3I8N0_9MICO|nr:tyrosine-type recombinase/integrase family protein [Myceligenerans salitolerans]MBO0609364.1 tyrosine-type recombinase/integrase family protein [Myceligenerans salitolerans]